MYHLTVAPCPCGSGLPRSECYDGHDCFMFFYCERCYAQKRAKFRADIFTRYESDEPIEPEDT